MTPHHVAQKCDESLLRLFGITLSKTTLRMAGYDEEQARAKLDLVTIEHKEALKELALAQADVAKVTARRGGAGELIVFVGDPRKGSIAGDITDAEVRELTPTALPPPVYDQDD
jgi:hypothetical protein